MSLLLERPILRVHDQSIDSPGRFSPADSGQRSAGRHPARDWNVADRADGRHRRHDPLRGPLYPAGLQTADPGVPRLVFQFWTAPDWPSSTVTLREAIFVTHRIDAGRPPLKAERHRVTAKYARCGEFESKASPARRLSCPGCSNRIHYRLTPRDAQSCQRN